MLTEPKDRSLKRRPAVAAITLAVALVAALLTLAAPSAVSANSTGSSVGDNVSYGDGAPASDVWVTLFEARDRWNRGAFLDMTSTDGHGNYRFDVAPGCYITVAIAPDGAEFDSYGSGKEYDQTYGCVDGGSNNDFDSVLYVEDYRRTTTTAPPKTTTTRPPKTTTTAPPKTTTTRPPKTTTTIAPTTTTTRPTTTTTRPTTTTEPPKECRKVERLGYWNQWGKGFSFSAYPSELGLSEFDGVNLRPVYRVLDQIGTRWHSQAGVDTHTGLINILVYYDRTNNNRVDYPSELELVFNDGKKKVHICFHVKLTMSPIGLDVDGSGSVERVSTDVAFDFDVDGEAESVSEWFAPTEGILVDTRIEGPFTGEHLFGDQGGLFADGYAKLALLDINRSGTVEGPELDGLAVWTDVNSNARFDAGELSTLDEHRVVALSTTHTNFVSEALLADGSIMVTEDLWFPVAAVAPGSGLVPAGVLLGGGSVLLGYSIVAARRRREGLDAELVELTTTEASTL